MPTATLPSVSPDLATAGETLVARRYFTWHGKRVEPGEVLDPQPEGRKREVLARAQFIVAHHNGILDTVARVQAVVPDGLVCPDCGRVLRHPSGLKTHRTRVHGPGWKKENA